ncbi:MAG: membrane integrity-associated transporter subunit PqiC [Rhodocyclaceae bacterium]|nr:membrane integrity-associated transporter subunit PqiC [Rhodocyclaceae bacterium]MBX3670518.1 membrane integrity-associated transporter subunit PqiC [Rhodocyclaceae bacterium]
MRGTYPHFRVWRALAGLAGAVLLCAACTTVSPPIEYYRLADPELAAGPKSSLSAAIGPVSLPETVDRAQLVLVVSPDRVAISDTRRWAAPLKNEVPRVLAGAVARALGGAHIGVAGLGTTATVDYRVTVDFRRFDAVAGQGVVLEAGWAVLSPDGRLLDRGGGEYRNEHPDLGFADIPAALSTALVPLARDIAGALAGANRAYAARTIETPPR